MQGIYLEKQKLCFEDSRGNWRDAGPAGLHSMADAIRSQDELPALLRRADSLPVIREEGFGFLPPVIDPGKIICVGLNYRQHIEEMALQMPGEPVIFAKFGNALAAHGQTIVCDVPTKMLDYEAELVLLIGKPCRKVREEDALSHCFGYTCGNDLSARDLQLKTGQWIIGKTSDGFAPLGPVVVTGDALDPGRLCISCRVNGHLRQQGNTADMVFSPAFLVSYLSQYMTLMPGDLIFTGTPSGVSNAMPEEGRKWLQAGDVVEVAIDGIGSLKNTIG